MNQRFWATNFEASHYFIFLSSFWILLAIKEQKRVEEENRRRAEEFRALQFSWNLLPVGRNTEQKGSCARAWKLPWVRTIIYCNLWQLEHTIWRLFPPFLSKSKRCASVLWNGRAFGFYFEGGVASHQSHHYLRLLVSRECKKGDGNVSVSVN